ncbi:hypothetical protein [Cellulomonas dongxiuzhuiae]|uniref:Uncharacterized protein n=1 Tax=Cellulomonas dongxiuzhuiae TaxID=2819979 RepID=A0ABX8GLW7_9CELL|nr:hypothetical protein [Cellulomonas dongxiuzhuiae]MBO3090005.1 hypothetical protein [Cellulomonas dongxiuzhuiae]MBO3095548.1 hypothetical protein [Cellulomonas dongxiuzhuiae]QWC16521.1 hypothetical protein KKR89_02280 [Cellulomonas dongxiuzhuiae]
MTSPARLRGRRAAPRPVPVAPVPPSGSRAGFVLYVSLPDDVDDEPDDEGTRPRPSARDLAETADLLRELAQDALPGAETFAALSLVPGTTGEVRRFRDRLPHLRLLDPVEDDSSASDPDVLSGSGDAR